MKRNDNEWIRKYYYRKCQRLFRIVKIESSCYSFILKHRHKEAYCAETWRRLYIMFEWFLDHKEEYGFEYVYIDHGCMYPYVSYIYCIDKQNDVWHIKFCNFADRTVKIQDMPNALTTTWCTNKIN